MAGTPKILCSYLAKNRRELGRDDEGKGAESGDFISLVLFRGLCKQQANVKMEKPLLEEGGRMEMSIFNWEFDRLLRAERGRKKK